MPKSRLKDSRREVSSLGKLTESLRWTFKNDLGEPFLELVLLVMVYEVATQAAVSIFDISDRFDSLTWNVIYPLLFLVGIGGVRCFSQGAERGELTRQLADQWSTRGRFILRKYFSFFLLTLAPLLAVDLISYIEFQGYFFLPIPVQQIGIDPSLFIALAVLEQLLLLFFLDSLVLALSVFLRKTTVVLFVFLAFTILGVYFYATTPPPSIATLQLGYGDYRIVYEFGQYLQYVLTYGFSGPHLPVLLASFYIGVAYRFLGGLVLLAASVIWFRRLDLD